MTITNGLRYWAANDPLVREPSKPFKHWAASGGPLLIARTLQRQACIPGGGCLKTVLVGSILASE